MENLPGADGTTPPSAAAAGPVAGAVPPAGSGSNGRGEGSGQPSAIDEVDALKTLVQAWTAQGARQRPVRKWTDLVGDLEDLASRVAALHAANPGDIDLGVANADVKKFLVAARQARAYTAARNQVEANRGNHAWEAQLSPPKGLPTEDQDKVTLLDQDSAVDRLFTGTGKQELVEELLSQGLKEWSPLPQNPATTPAQDVDLDDLDHTTATFPIEGPSVEELVVGAGTTALGVGVGLLMLRSIDGAEKFCAFPGACALKGP